MKSLLLSLLAFFPAFHAAAAGWHGGSLKGLVVDAATNTELSGVLVRLSGAGERTAASNELGLFNFEDLPAAEYTVTLSLVGYESASQTVRVSDHQTSNIKFELKVRNFELADVEVSIQNSRPLTTLSQVDLQTRPINSAQDILRFVPGLVIAQHAGGGKAEQIFLRGFDIDHGTDIALSVDGIPVNMVSHAHGQGYADLHFLIPELVERVDFQKGPYYASVGNLCTAGYVKFRTPDALRSNFLTLEGGQFDTYRTAAGIDLLGQRAASQGTSAYVAGETMFTNAYFDSPQNFKRINLFGKIRQAYDEGKVITLSVSRFSSSWLASGQIPERSVKSGRISPFGAIDPTEGGRTSRLHVNLEHSAALSANTVIKNQFYLSRYTFELYSNFTFFLEDPVNGDQIRQKEDRTLSGYNGALIHDLTLAGRPLHLENGVQLRYDDIRDDELSHTRARLITLNRLALGDVQEIDFAAYSDANWALTKRFNLNLGLRFDQFHFSYNDKLDSTQALFLTQAKAILNPKLNLNYRITEAVTLYAQAGSGFHSNDTRVVVREQAENTLSRAAGCEAGLLLKPFPDLLLSASAWQLDLEQEFVYVGDAAVVEPSGKSRRRGVDVSVRWQAAPWLYFDADYNFTRPRATGEPEGARYIPLAPTQTSIGGLTLTTKKGFSGSLRYRYLADRPANEDNSLVAEGWFLLDALASYTPVWKNRKSPLEFRLSAQNLTGVLWKEAQFATESRLFDEPAPVTEIHYTPGTPFFLKGGLTLRF